jgi:hypothetical protein
MQKGAKRQKGSVRKIFWQIAEGEKISSWGRI